MRKYPVGPLLLTNVLFCLLFIGISVIPAAAVPVLQDRNKQPVSSIQKSPDKKRSPQKIIILGNYKGTSLHKKQVSSPGRESSRTIKTVEQTVTVTKTYTTKTASRGHARIQKKISAKSAMVMDASNGQTIFAVAPDTPRQPASTIKILTGMIALKSLDVSESISVSSKAAAQPSSKVYLERKKQYKADDLINAVLLSSANDASVAIAEKIAGSEKSFAQMMTLRAKLWGAQRTICKTANGLTAAGQTSTARDLATIFRRAMEDKEFSQRMKQVKAHTAEGKLLRNHNKALWQIKGAIGGKTGFTNAAGQTYVGKFKRGSNEIIVAIMGSRTMWADLKTLVEYGFSQQAITAAENSKSMKEVKVIASIPAVSEQQ
jgi:D-alanyl-D-alanine carboxypeptidase (penicillin-binding protein 5/6)